MQLEAINDTIRSVYANKPWIVTADAAAGTTSIVAKLKEFGASKVMVVSGSEGIGDLPDADRIHYTRTSGSTIMEGFRTFHDSIEDPSPELIKAVDRFDPEGIAQVKGQGFSRQTTLAGREVYGRRPTSWGDLEDKTTVDTIFAHADVTTAPYAIVPVTEATAAADQLATPLGTVWAADNTEGWHGGGEYTKWVRSADDIDPNVEWFSSRAESVRVMPFLDGLPCSIHGFITRSGTAVFRPVELYILRTLDTPGFLYGRVGNLWSPSPDDAEAMRAAVRRVADVLSERVGYLGSFGIDGVLTRDGFRPTELNPRMSVGSAIQWFASGLPLGDMELLLLEGDLEVDASELERFVMDWSETNRRSTFMFPSSTQFENNVEIGFVFEDGDVTAIDLDESGEAAVPIDGTMRAGPTAFGSAAFARLDQDRIEQGPSTAPLAIPLMAMARDLWDLELPDCAAATDVRAG